MLLIAGNPIALLVGAFAFLFAYIVLVRGEERYLLDRFGRDFIEYCRTTPRWMPRLRGLAATFRPQPFDWSAS